MKLNEGKFVNIEGKNYSIGKNYKDNPKKNIAYKYKDGNYYLFRGNYNSNKPKKTGFYDKSGKIVLVKKKNSDNKKYKKLIHEIIESADEINDNAKTLDMVLTEEEKKKIFAPPIKESNSILIKIIKQILEKEQIPEKILKMRFDSMSDFNNYKRALIIRDSITIECFSTWMDKLNKEWHIEIEDKK